MRKLTVVEKAGAPGPFLQLIADYLDEKRAGGVSGKTIHLYRDALEDVLLPYCAKVGATEPSELTTRHLNGLSIGLLDGTGSRSGRPLAKPTVNSYMGSISSFIAWAQRSGADINAKAQRPRLPQRVLDTLSREEIRAMEDAAGDERDKLLVRVLADTGMRLGELRGLSVDDLRLEGRKHYLKVRGKGGRERLVPISPALHQRLSRYIQRTRKASSSDRIFLSLRRRPRSGEHEALTQSGAEQAIHNLAEAAGIRKRVYPHLLRHSFITEQLRQGANPILLARVVGHTSLAMINSVYQHLSLDDAHNDLMRALLAADEKR
jgi:integrase/recombinase XerD